MYIYICIYICDVCVYLGRLLCALEINNPEIDIRHPSCCAHPSYRESFGTSCRAQTKLRLPLEFLEAKCEQIPSSEKKCGRRN